MADKKRTRNPNFSLKEKRTLLECAYEEKAIIENKKTDGVTWKKKETAWERIASNFNSHSDSACYRTVEALKKFYQGYKKEIRKVAADEKMSRIQTGGGKAINVRDENFDLAISIMNPKTITGYENIFDGDGADELFENEPGTSTNIIEERQGDEPIKDWGKYKPSQLRNPIHPKLKRSHENISDEQEVIYENIDDNSPKTSILMSKGFKKQFDNSTTKTENKSNWCGRRRPVASTLPSSKITEQYTQLSEIKIELAKLQYDTQKEEATQKKYTASIEHELRKRSLELDIEIKTEFFKKIKSDSFRMCETCSILKDLGNLNPK
ncbi:uncharacterized protein LOC129950445 [Eupeodes corollae]|uniref:uncharacterized protein LOC129950445 n=1 Tax=Eupeodes corollae TaxID=290404 RepID=UPI002491E150|nr:uncharacterized protein LOC129950445 [Eupeodes corollae]